MYYKIENQHSSIFKALFEIRMEEIRMEADNRKAITAKTGLAWKAYLGHAGQQNFNRVCQFDGFVFNEPEKVDLKIWRRHKKHTDVFVPNKHTAKGKEMANFLLNDLEGSCFINVYKELNLRFPTGKFCFPYVEVRKKVIILKLDDKANVDHPDLIEITMKEFNELNEKE